MTPGEKHGPQYVENGSITGVTAVTLFLHETNS